MNSLVKVFSNFKEFYSEINGATLTGAIDVIVVEQPNGTYLCSPFHVRFGKLGVLRSRQKIVDIEVNGEPVDIHMKLGESGEAFFVEECDEDDLEQLPANMATSPLPTSEFVKFAETAIFNNVNDEENIIDLPKPRRNSIDFSKESDEIEKKFENQVSDFSHRRHTDTMQRHDLSAAKKEYTTQKIRQEWAEHEEHILGTDGVAEEWTNPTESPSQGTPSSAAAEISLTAVVADAAGKNNVPASVDSSPDAAGAAKSVASLGEETKSKKKRRKKSMMKKKAATQRKGSSSSSVGSANSDQNDPETDTVSLTATTSSDNSPKAEPIDATPLSDDIAPIEADELQDTSTPEKSPIESKTAPIESPAMSRARDLDIHFFSDTELASAKSPDGSRPSTPIQSDSEFEMSHRANLELNKADIMTASSASWKWGELPTQGDESQVANTEDAKQAQRNSMVSKMFSFMKQSKKLRKTSQAEGVYLSELDTEGMDPEVAALYFPPHCASQSERDQSAKKLATAGGVSVDDDRESGNGTSLPHSPSSLDGLKSLDSDYDDGKPSDNKTLDFVAMSLCGGIENGTGPTDEEFERNLIGYNEVCQNPSIFASPLLVVRLNGKYYSWAAACPIVMTIITYQKPLTIDAIEQLMNRTPSIGNSAGSTPDEVASSKPDSQEQQQQRGYSSWWLWRRSGGGANGVAPVVDKSTKVQQQQLHERKESESADNANEKDDAPTDEQQLPPATSSAAIDICQAPAAAAGADNESADTSDLFNKSLDQSDDAHLGETYRKSLRLTSKQIESLNLKHGMNEISFSVTTAYQGTSRCKCYLFRWKHNDKVVISDIDGTITKSDVLGHILPMVGRDWAQIGVAQLFSKIEENGYKLLYLSARAIGQSRATREYLRSIRQGDVKLPDGPLLLNPTSLISAFHREVIEKKPEQFKIACLSDIRDLFPEKNPFYAGYGNRINDVWAYRAVGIPIMRIFTINPKGELKHELTQTFQSSYCNMAYIADQLFPPIATIEESAEFSNFNFWREPVFELDDLVPHDVLDGVAVDPPTPLAGNEAPPAEAYQTSSTAEIAQKAAAKSSSTDTSEDVAETGQPGSPGAHSKTLPTIPENRKM